MALVNTFDTAKYAEGNGIADKVYGALDGGFGLAGDIGSSVQKRRQAKGLATNPTWANNFNNMKTGGGQFDFSKLFGGGSSSASGGTSGATGAKGMATGAIGNAIDKTWAFTNNMIGDVYTKGRSKFDSGVLNTAYGQSTDDPFFGGIGRNRNTERLANDIRNEGFVATSNNMGDLQNEISSTNIFNGEVSGISDGQRTASVFQGSASGAAKGAKIGSNFGPWGMAIGAIAGGVGGAVSKLFGNQRAKRRLAALNKAIRYSNMSKDQQVQDSVNNMVTMNNNKMFARMEANGGWHEVMDRYNAGLHYFADGGKIESSSTKGKISQSKEDWPGITEINAGGSHEENPNGGVLQGIAPDGAPNLVEQGEVKISDITGGGNQYVLSARIVITPEMAQLFGIDSKLVGLTYADGFKKAYSQYKERQGNPEVRNEVASLISKFQQAQDAEKAQREAQMQMAVMQSMTPDQQQMMAQMAEQEAQAQAQAEQQAQAQQAAQMGQDPMAQQQMMQQGGADQLPPEAMQGQQPMSEAEAQQMMMLGGGQQPMANGGRFKTTKVRRYDDGGSLSSYVPLATSPTAYPNSIEPRISAPILSYPMGRSTSLPYPNSLESRYQPQYPTLPRFLQRLYARLGAPSYPTTDTPAATQTPTATAASTDDDAAIAGSERAKIYDDLGVDSMRRRAKLDKAPVIAGLYSWLRSKDYMQDADKYNRIIREGMSRSMVSPERLGGYYRPRYVDPNFNNAALSSSSAQALRNAAMLTNGNRAAAAAVQSSIFDRATRARGEQLYQAQLANEQARAQAAQMNNGIDQANAQMRMQAAADNANRIYNAYGLMEQNTAGVDQYNKTMKHNLYQNVANLMGKYGVDARNRMTAAVMAGNGLFGKGAENVYTGK